MVLRRQVTETWVRELELNQELLSFGRAGRALGAHDDRAMAWAAFSLGLEVAYIPSLRLLHLIPPQRLDRDYLGRLLHGMAYSGEFFVSARSSRPPPAPPPFVALRKLRRYIFSGAAFSPFAYVWWRHYCGILDARTAWHNSATRDATPPTLG